MEIRAATAGDIPAVQLLWREYWDSLGLPGDFQGFDQECRTLPGEYLLWIATHQGQPVGTAALRPLRNGACEAKRLYVRPANRGQGIAKALLDRLIEAARAYGTLYADTLPSMSAALQLYRAAGFMEVGPYSQDPTPGAIYLALKLPPAIAPTTK